MELAAEHCSGKHFDKASMQEAVHSQMTSCSSQSHLQLTRQQPCHLRHLRRHARQQSPRRCLPIAAASSRQRWNAEACNQGCPHCLSGVALLVAGTMLAPAAAEAAENIAYNPTGGSEAVKNVAGFFYAGLLAFALYRWVACTTSQTAGTFYKPCLRLPKQWLSTSAGCSTEEHGKQSQRWAPTT